MSPFKHEYLTYTPPDDGVQESKTCTDGFGWFVWLAVGSVGFLQAESVYKVTATLTAEATARRLIAIAT
jgi:hypothetical protein